VPTQPLGFVLELLIAQSGQDGVETRFGQSAYVDAFWRHICSVFSNTYGGSGRVASSRVLHTVALQPAGNPDFAGDLSERDFAAALHTHNERGFGHLAIAVVLLSRGDRVGALDHQRRYIETPRFQYIGFEYSMALRNRMERDPTWPPWIPPKK